MGEDGQAISEPTAPSKKVEWNYMKQMTLEINPTLSPGLLRLGVAQGLKSTQFLAVPEGECVERARG